MSRWPCAQQAGQRSIPASFGRRFRSGRVTGSRTPPRLRTLTIAATMIVIAFGQPQSTPVRGSDLAASQSSADSIMRFRATFGLATDSSTLAAAGGDSGFAYGIPLTPSERADLDRRVAVQDALGPLEAYIAANDEAFGGLWLDQAHGGALVVEPVVLGNPDLAAVGLLVPPGAKLVVRPVSRSARALQDAQAAVESDMPNMRAAGIAVESVSVDPITNTVRVGVSNWSSDTERAILDRYGTAVTVVAQDPVRTASLPTTCTSRSVCPLRAGLDISNISSDRCTAGYFFRDGGSSSVWYSTAGHCWSNTYFRWYLGQTTTYFIGINYAKNYYSGMSADAMLMTQSSSSAKNLIYVSSAQPGRTVTTWKSNTSQTMGSIVCATGLISGYQCGTINGVNLAENVPIGIEYHLWRASFPSAQGDSGGPVFYSASAMGLTTATDGTNTYYSTIDWIDSAFGVTPCITTGC